MADLRESGAIEQDADNILFIHHATATDLERGAEPGPVKLLLAKARNGPKGVVTLMYFPQYTRFENCERQFQEESEDVPF